MRSLVIGVFLVSVVFGQGLHTMCTSCGGQSMNSLFIPSIPGFFGGGTRPCPACGYIPPVEPPCNSCGGGGYGGYATGGSDLMAAFASPGIPFPPIDPAYAAPPVPNPYAIDAVLETTTKGAEEDTKDDSSTDGVKDGGEDSNSQTGGDYNSFVSDSSRTTTAYGGVQHESAHAVVTESPYEESVLSGGQSGESRQTEQGYKKKRSHRRTTNRA